MSSLILEAIMKSFPNIVTLSGCSGAGKTTLVEALKQRHPEVFCDVLSYTTREPREEDGRTYSHCTEEDFSGLEKVGEFAWTTTYRGKRYGTRKADLVRALDKPRVSLMIITPQTVDVLRRFLDPRHHSKLYHLYLLSPDYQELRRRLVARGDSEEAITKAMEETCEWDRKTFDTELPFDFIPSLSSAETLIERAEEMLHLKGVV
jgi:guanylate kinase